MDKTIPGKIMQHVIIQIASSFIFTAINPENRQLENFDAQYFVMKICIHIYVLCTLAAN
jgi:hypothetical protein